MKHLHFKRFKLFTILLLFQNVSDVHLTDEIKNEIDEIEEDKSESSITRLHAHGVEPINILQG